MGNQACCEEQAKGPQFAEYKFKTNTSKIEPFGKSSAASKSFSHKKALIDKQQPIQTKNSEPVEGIKHELKKQSEEIKPSFHIQEQKIFKVDSFHASQQSSSLGEAARKNINRSLFHEQSSEKSIKQIQSNKLESSIKSNSGLPIIPTIQLESHRKNLQELEPQHSSLLQPHPNKQNQKLKQQEQIPQIIIPDLSQEVAVVLEKNKFFEKKNCENAMIRQYGDDYFQGQLDQERNIPDGFGKFYKKDGSLYIGHFLKGKGNGEGVFIFPDGSYYQGNFKANEAEDQKGIFKSKQLQYAGGFLKNRFEGNGNEKGASHTFTGQYEKGERVRGTLEWVDNGAKYSYTGPFKNQLFHGVGVLKQPKGTYEGDFVNGKKHGYGVYNFSNSLCYKGDYQNGQRSGKGALYNCDGSITYEGQFLDGIPHGIGYIVDKNGEKASAKWIQGIDAQLL